MVSTFFCLALKYSKNQRNYILNRLEYKERFSRYPNPNKTIAILSFGKG